MGTLSLPQTYIFTSFIICLILNILQTTSANNGIKLTSLNSTAVKFEYNKNLVDNLSNDGLSDKHHTQEQILYKITYQLDLANLLLYEDDTCQHKSLIVDDEKKEMYRNSCKSELHRFGSSTIDDSDLSDNYCDPKTVTTNQSMIIGNLLPHQKYHFKYEGSYSWGNQTETIIPHEEDTICMDNSAPLYSPQTDLGAYRTTFDPRCETVRRVEVYWRPLPKAFLGAKDIQNVINCFDLEEKNKLVVDETLYDNRHGMIDMNYPFKKDHAYSCHLKSRNKIGASSDTSHIYIPRMNQTLRFPDKLVLHAAAISNEKYYLSWINSTDFLTLEKETIKMLNKTSYLNRPYSSGTYTIYWCSVTAPADGCTSIEGLYKTKTNKIMINIPTTDKGHKHRIFGISYRSYNNLLNTGIKWSNCVYLIGSQFQPLNEAVYITKAVGVVDDHSAMVIDWQSKGCSAITAVIDSFEINYCFIENLDPCLAQVAKNETIFPEITDFDGNRNCSTVFEKNEMTNELILKNLNASTKYAIRIRHYINNKPVIYWSRPIFGHTLADKTKSDRCSLGNIQRTISTLLLRLVFIVFPLLYIIRKSIVFCSKIVKRFNRANTGMPQRIEASFNKADNLSEVGLKYWINRFPAPVDETYSTSSECSLDVYAYDSKTCMITKRTLDHCAKNEDEDKEDYNNQLSNIPEYIPSQMLSHDNQSTQGSLTESLQDNEREDDNLSDSDELSVTSHSSFLENILNNEFNNALLSSPQTVSTEN